MSGSITVAGGAGGLEAKYDDLLTLADKSDDVGRTLGDTALRGSRLLVDQELLASAVLDPGGWARVERALVEAVGGPYGAGTTAARYGMRAAGVRFAATKYELTDRALAELRDLKMWTDGVAVRAAGGGLITLQPWAVPLGVAAVASVAGPEAIGHLAWDGVQGKFDLGRWITEHPGVVDGAVGATPGFFGLQPGDVAGAAGLAALLYPDGKARVTDLGRLQGDVFASSGLGTSRVQRLMSALSQTNEATHGSSGGKTNTQGTITVRTITDKFGKKAYLVDLPGTKDWHFNPGHSPDLNDLGTNLHAMAGHPTAYQRGVAEALLRAGAPEGAAVMLVGHSQGGIVAMQAAARSGTPDFPYRVTHVVTAGSPVGRIEVPDSVRVLSLENKHDIVAHLDAAANPPTHNRTTVTLDEQHGSPGQNHAMEATYQPIAKEVDAMRDSSVEAFLDSAGAYFDGDVTDSQRYQLSRA